MRITRIALLAGSLGLLSGCDDFLDVNTNPNAPEVVSPNLYLPPMQHWMVSGQQYDGRFIGRYTQQFKQAFGVTVLPTWDRMGYDPGSDNGGQQWRDIYWSFGQNLVDMMNKAEAEQRWDVLGVGYVLKAWGWQQLANVHGEVIIKEAFDPTKTRFNFDSQEFAYEEARRLLALAITNLERTDGAVDQAYLGRGDRIYNGDRAKWIRFANGLLAMNLNHYSNKGSYRPADVIAAVDRALQSNADDALLSFPNATLDDINPLGRNSGSQAYQNYRQTQFVVNLMNGTEFGGVVDPRMSRMLAPDSLGTTYRGLDINRVGFDGLPATLQPRNFYGYTGNGGLLQPGRYLFDNKARLPAMTYSQLQFVKAEAALKLGNRPMALEAYRNGVSSHIDFVNARNSDAGQTPSQITAAEKAAFLASPAIIPTAANLTLTHVMSQKYIAQWAWGHNELWMDMRRYHYTDVDPATGRQVFPGFAPPTNLYVDNAGKLAYRLRPRYNSEYVWNREGLDAIGGLDSDFHTDIPWIIQP